ncbi:unnamed protein product [Symbiodinium natans]|uniref:Uncharacterized protein n=1 Tax=Symbiodinium natans TaxID=878477 RepID=A0A812KVU8_9DINO|nr:unnamed protein product [Symbiodinium natans]
MPDLADPCDEREFLPTSPEAKAHASAHGSLHLTVPPSWLSFEGNVMPMFGLFVAEPGERWCVEWAPVLFLLLNAERASRPTQKSYPFFLQALTHETDVSLQSDAASRGACC